MLNALQWQTENIPAFETEMLDLCSDGWSEFAFKFFHSDALPWICSKCIQRFLSNFFLFRRSDMEIVFFFFLLFLGLSFLSFPFSFLTEISQQMNSFIVYLFLLKITSILFLSHLVLCCLQTN